MKLKMKNLKFFHEFKIFNKKYFIKNDGASMSEALGKAFIKLPKIIEKSNPDYNFIWF